MQSIFEFSPEDLLHIFGYAKEKFQELNIVATKQSVVVTGLGEVGRPLFELASRFHRTLGVDLEPIEENVTNADVLHICFPFQIKDFVGETLRYMDRYQPALTVINSTVGVGTTRRIAERSGAMVVNSPIRGKHARMLVELMSYSKFIGAIDSEAGEMAAKHFQSMGLKTRVFSSPETTELAKLTETTYFGLLIAWAQELERYCDQVGTSYDDIASFYEEIKYLPGVKFFPGVIGGHCVMPNIKILNSFTNSDLLDAIQSSNEHKRLRELEIERETSLTA